MTTPPDAAQRAALRALEVVLVVVGAYALAMIVLGSTVNRAFDALGFGVGDYAATAAGPRAYALLLQGVIGAVIVGWVLLLLAVVRHGLGPDPDGPWWAAVVTSVAAWFVLDTGFSLAVGSWQHAAFNLAFALAIAVPLAVLRPRRAVSAG